MDYFNPFFCYNLSGDNMKLVTFQSYEALKYLINNGYLECDPKNIDLSKTAKVYDYIIDMMNKSIKNNSSAKYPLWCWVKCYNNICPPKHKGKKIEGFDVKITFNKDKKDIFITDFRRYSFLLNNILIPNSIKEKEEFDKLLKKYNITHEDLKAYIRNDKNKRSDKDFLNICQKIEKTFDRCITSDSDILQGCIWRIDLKDIEKIEILNDDSYTYGSLNYIRSNGKRFDWIKDYYKLLK